jgi:putative ABC transport system permease protein
MNNFILSLAYLRHKASTTMMHVVTFASGVAIVVALLLTNAQLQNEFTKNLEGIDLVVGAKGSPMQLILSSVFHLDIPTGNIPLEEAEKIEKHPLVKSTIPIALGDNYNGFRIVGTNADYLTHYQAQIAQGAIFNQAMEVVLGSEVAAQQRSKLGDQIVGAHGLTNSDDLHTDFPYTVVGILKPTNTVLDRLVLTGVQSVWHVHEHPDEDDAEEVAHKKEHPGNEITALLVSYKSPMAAATMPRMVNSTTNMQAASPAFEVAWLTSFMGIGSDALQIVGYFLIALAALGMLVTLTSAMNERRYDLALMRSFGASPAKLCALVVTESVTIAMLGVILGIVFGHLAVEFLGAWLADSKHIQVTGKLFLTEEKWLLAAGLGIGVIAAVIPALKVYRIDIFKALVKR